MDKTEITNLIDAQRTFFATGSTLNADYRITALRKLKNCIKAHEQDIMDALRTDLGKGSQESYMCEVGLTLSEISYMLSHTRRFMREKTVATPLAQFASRSYVKPSPYGTVLIMSPWNYPFLLTMEPLVDALAAGNTAIIKPSAYSPATSEVISKIVGECFNPEYVAVVTGGRAENTCLLDADFDYIFFTGSKTVGKEVMRHAAEHLTPVTLELGGKSPCIVAPDADLKLAARRIVFGKYLNCGQTCVAPDYVLCHSSVYEKFIEYVKAEIIRQFSDKPLENPEYGKIINEKHFNRILGLIDRDKLVFGGASDADALRIEPVVMRDITEDDAVMKEEIFGPVMPVLSYDDTEGMIARINSHDHPLALYVFSGNKAFIKKITSSISFGGGCVNDTIIHLATSNMGFGGVGGSGMGSYHGRDGFNTFSHRKSIVDKKTWLDLPMRYQPYSGFMDRMIRMFLK